MRARAAGVLLGLIVAAASTDSAQAVEDDPRHAAALLRLRLSSQAAARLDVTHPTAVTLRGRPLVVVPRDATLADVRAAVPAAVRTDGHGAWTLLRTIVVTRGARLRVAAPQVRVLRLRSTAKAYVTLTAWGADLSFAGQPGRPLTVTSWDPTTSAPDARLTDGRASVSSINGGRLDARHTSFQSLGFSAGILSGVAIASGYNQPRGSGDLTDSTFRDNYFGAYTYNAAHMRWLRDRFVDNHVYGFDPHDNSDRFLVRDSYAAGNGRHGIIFSRFCDTNVIAHNVSERNGWHGIVLDDGKAADGPSNDNVVLGNIVRDNRLVGISIDGSGSNLIARNRVTGSGVGVRVYGPATGNTVIGNRIGGVRDFGVFLIAPATRTKVINNAVDGAATGVRIQRALASTVRDNQLTAMTDHGIFVDAAHPARATGVIAGNRVEGAGASPLQVMPLDVDGVDAHAGPTAWRYPLAHRIERWLSWIVGPGLWLLLALVAVGGGVVVRLVDHVRRLRRPAPR